MKVFFTVLVLIFCVQSWTNADDIGDFEIEGMSIGDSLLDYMDKKQIQNQVNNKDFSIYYKDDYVAISLWNNRNKFQIYDDVGVILKQNDPIFKIYALEGTLYMDEESNIEECYKKQDIISNDIKEVLKIKNKGDTWFVEKKNLQNYLSSVKYIDYELSDGSLVRTTCYEVIKGVRKHSDLNLLYVVLDSATFYNYLKNN